MQVNINSPMTVTVGAGGSGSPGTYGANPVTGFTGGNSSIGDIVGYSGGGGGSGHTAVSGYSGNANGASGNGGGAGGDSAKSGEGKGMGTDPAPLDIPQGYSGGSAKPYSYGAGGGGGANRPGGAGRYLSERSGNGGDGVLASLSGTAYYWGGGGGGAGWAEGPGGNGGLGGGGGGSVNTSYTAGTGDTNAYNAGGNGTAATNSNGGAGGTNTGGGGGGGTHAYSVGGNGGSGIVIIRYSGSQKATGGTITSSGGYTIHTFTSSGTFTPTEWIGPKDLSEISSTLTVNGATYSSDNGGNYFFNGSSDKITLSSNALLSGTQDHTIIAAIKVNAVSVDYIFGNYGPGNSGGLEYYVYQSRLNHYISGNVQSSTNLNANQWYIVAVTRSGNTITHYLNGVADGSSTNSAGIATNNPFTIGNGHDYTSEAFGGNIGFVYVYNRALTVIEIQQNFNALRGRYGI
jgi:hypothetical protein